MKSLDGDHKLDSKTKRVLSSVIVTPLQPPFRGTVTKFKFFDDNVLAVSKKDGERIKALIDGKSEGQEIVLGRVDGAHIRVSLEGWDE